MGFRTFAAAPVGDLDIDVETLPAKAHSRAREPFSKIGNIVEQSMGPEGPERHPMAVSSTSAPQSLAIVALNVTKQSQAVNAQVVQSAVETARDIAHANQSASGGAAVDIKV